MAGVKSTKTLGYALKGIFSNENLTITEVSDEEEVVHDVEELLEKFNGKEVSFSISLKEKLENGIE